MIECIFGWDNLHGTMRKTKHRGIACVGVGFLVNHIAYNLVRIPKLIATWEQLCPLRPGWPRQKRILPQNLLEPPPKNDGKAPVSKFFNKL